MASPSRSFLLVFSSLCAGSVARLRQLPGPFSSTCSPNLSASCLGSAEVFQFCPQFHLINFPSPTCCTLFGLAAPPAEHSWFHRCRLVCYCATRVAPLLNHFAPVIFWLTNEGMHSCVSKYFPDSLGCSWFCYGSFLLLSVRNAGSEPSHGSGIIAQTTVACVCVHVACRRDCCALASEQRSA